MNEEANLDEAANLGNPIAVAIAELVRLTHFSRGSHQARIPAPAKGFPRQRCSDVGRPRGAPGNSSIAHHKCNARSARQTIWMPEGIRASVLLWHYAAASCTTLLLKLVKLGRWSGSARAASRSPSSRPARHPKMAAGRGAAPWTRGSPPDTPRRAGPAAPSTPHGRPSPATLAARASAATMVLAAARSGRKPGLALLTKTSGLRIRGSSRRSHPTPKEGVLVQGFPRVR